MKQPLKIIVMQSIMVGVLLNDERGKYSRLGLSVNMINNLSTIMSIISTLYYLITGEVILFQKVIQEKVTHHGIVNTLNVIQLITQLSVRFTVLATCWLRRELLLRSTNNANVILESMKSSHYTKKSYILHCLVFPIFLILRILEATNCTINHVEHTAMEIFGQVLLLWANLITDVIMVHFAALAYCVELALKNINDHIRQEIMASQSEILKDQQVNVSTIPYYSYFQSQEIMPILNGVGRLINVKLNKSFPDVSHRAGSHIGYSDSTRKLNRQLLLVTTDLERWTNSRESSTMKSQETRNAPLYRIAEFLGCKKRRSRRVHNLEQAKPQEYCSRRSSLIGTVHDNGYQISQLMYRYINIERLVSDIDRIYRVQLMAIFWSARICGTLAVHSLFSEILSGHPANLKRLLITGNSLAVLFLPLLHACNQAERAVKESWQTRTALLAANSGRVSKDFYRSVSTCILVMALVIHRINPEVELFIGQVETIPIHFDVGLGKPATLVEVLSVLISIITTVIVMIQFSSPTSATTLHTSAMTNFTSLPNY